MRIRSVVGWGSVLLGLALVAAITVAVVAESRSSRWQAAWLSDYAGSMRYDMQPGPSAAIRLPGAGPFDQRLGYAQLAGWVDRLDGAGFVITAQARMSPPMQDAAERGLYPPYHEKTQAGLTLHDCRGESLFAAQYPRRVYTNFDALPPLLVQTLLFIENRTLLDPPATRNPAVEWQRLGKAVLDHARHRVDSGHATVGGSTLATQIEKYRHSPGGRTEAPREKLVQMASASLRAYLDGPDTLPRRRQIVVDYLDTVPLSARAGFGEVIGLGDALWAWYGRDFAEFNRLLQGPQDAAQALAYKQALSLLVAQRRPSYYLSPAGADALRALTDSHLRVLAGAGVIGPELRDAALPLALPLRHDSYEPAAASFADHKAPTLLRNRLLGLLALPSPYDLDRLDLQVHSSFSVDAQRAASALLRSLQHGDAARAAGLFGPYLLNDGDDMVPIRVSFTLFESAGTHNLLRVQTDNLDQPFDLNDGTRLDLGSTAKLRTLITYLEQVAALHRRWSGLDAVALAALPVERRDPIGRWARDHLAQASDRSLRAMLDAALQRRYSASPAETFFTGGGEHRFENFEPRDDGRTMSVEEALTRSVNLVFIRLMRDVVRRVMADSEHIDPQVLADRDHPRRAALLERFADEEGRVYLSRFYRRYQGLSPATAERQLLDGVRKAPVPLANAFYGLEPDGDAAGLALFLQRHLPGAAAQAEALHAGHGPGRWSLADQAYLAGVHPLELWLAGHLRRHPDASLAEVIAASAAQRQQAYAWLFKTRHKGAQDRRIRELQETLAFEEIARAWQRLGYPFQALTPSYASALGASGDRPSALAELMGIVVNRGLRLPTTPLQSLTFAAGTPYETRLQQTPAAPQRVLDAEVAEMARRALIGVVEDGTGRRLKGALVRRDGSVVAIGGKTGTGDHRYDVYGRGGRLVSSRVVNRSATLVFLLGERHFGTLMVYVHEPHAARYRFTSALPTQLLKALTPTLLQLVDGPTCTPGTAAPRPAGP